MTDKLPEESTELYDDCFHVKESAWKTWNSYQTDGTKLVTSLTKQFCIDATCFYLKSKQETALESVKTYEGTVGGKL
jgi:hypothetical protein